jgi:hypothetical protein
VADRLIKFALAVQGIAEVVVSQGVLGLEAEGRLEVTDRLIQPVLEYRALPRLM